MNPQGAGRAIRVLVAGPDGAMGRVMMSGLPSQPGIAVVGGLRRGDPAEELLASADVLVEFTHPDSAPDLVLAAIEAGVRAVSGTSGMPESALVAIDEAAREQGIAAVWASHFRLAGILMMHLSAVAARFMDSVEIIEAHHAGKADAPSGTARELARMMQEAHGGELSHFPSAKVTLDGVRGGQVGGVGIHSLRLPPGVLGVHEVIFGGDQELLTIRHDEYGREAYVPSVARAVHEVVRPDRVGLIRGYGAVIGLDEDPHETDGA